MPLTSHLKFGVALRKESVDRNRACIMTTTICIASLSARRAWIEINSSLTPARMSSVALRKESVDRNKAAKWAVGAAARSLSARRAWIEM